MTIGRLYLILFFSLVAEIAIADDSKRHKELVTDFWQADGPDALALARKNLLDETNEVHTLYQWMREGPTFSAEVALGIQSAVQKGTSRTRFPYEFVVPESYDPARKYPVEFMLHGQISVFPASWRKARWWKEKQADNLPEILRQIKRTYNVDDDRVYLSGVSDGGTGTYFYAFKQPNEWAGFLPFIGSPLVLTNPKAGGGFPLNFENLTNVAMHIVNGEKDTFYPIEGIKPVIDILKKQNTNFSFTMIENGGHNLRWIPDHAAKIAEFKKNTTRNTSPKMVRWATDRVDRYNRIHWIRVDGIDKKGKSGWIAASRNGNTFSVFTDAVTEFSLLLNPETADFDKPITVAVNKEIVYSEIVKQDPEILLDWAENLDKTQLYTAELRLSVPR